MSAPRPNWKIGSPTGAPAAPAATAPPASASIRFFTASIRLGLAVQLSRPPRSMELRPIRQKLKSRFSRSRDAMSSTARFAVSEYSIDCRKCQGCGAIGYGRSARGSCCSGMNGMVVGVGLPMVSVSSPIWLWKYTVVRSPPFHHVE